MLFSSVVLYLFATLGCIAGVFAAGFDNVQGSGKGSGVVEVKGDPPLVSFDSLGNLQLVISLINKYRAAHQSPPVTWNTTLAQYAANVAYPYCRFQTSHGPYGEILAGSATANNPEWFIWFNFYDENKSYDFKNPRVYDNATKHLTQIVWAGSKQVGFAFVTGCDKTLKYQLWCEFSPKGNTGSQSAYRNNVKVADRTKEIPGMPPAII
ncbi:uncharacterized protein DFL_003440 [Arthrobotrys flagrans]|uniref:SCP domain-containing protein n=1 Tax=Arthrobotrys flagrans TaxID=97331 RepID=A0A437A1T9_ARTFL|nr:hypothetical protein DFL_003440 [Arthrobotrys flagrans]